MKVSNVIMAVGTFGISILGSFIPISSRLHFSSDKLVFKALCIPSSYSDRTFKYKQFNSQNRPNTLENYDQPSLFSTFTTLLHNRIYFHPVKAYSKLISCRKSAYDHLIDNVHSQDVGEKITDSDPFIYLISPILYRLDTLHSLEIANTNPYGINHHNNFNMEPLQCGIKTNILIVFCCFAYKCYRSIFINKLAIWERQPQWNTIITSKEEDKNSGLLAMTCRFCQSTLFIAKGRKWFQMPRGYECYCCGAKGMNNFTNTREKLIETLDDDYFDFEKPLDFVTRSDRKILEHKSCIYENNNNNINTSYNTNWLLYPAQRKISILGDVVQILKRVKSVIGSDRSIICSFVNYVKEVSKKHTNITPVFDELIDEQIQDKQNSTSKS